MNIEKFQSVLSYTEFIREKSAKTMGIVFSVMAVITTFISVDEILDKLQCKSLILKIGILVGVCIICIIWNVLLYENKKSIIIYEKGRTRIQFEYGDIQRDYIKDNKEEPYTVVIPIDTELNGVFDKDKIRKNSIHGYWIKQMETMGYSQAQIVPMVKTKMKANKDGTCEQGTVCYLEGLRGNVNYLLAATVTFNSDTKHFYCSRKQYYNGIHNIIEGINYLCSQGERVYMPLIGAGYARMGKTEAEMIPIMAELLVFNADKLNNEIHIIVYEKRKNIIPIFSLLKKL